MLNFYPILPFLGPCFPPTIPIVFDTNFIFESFWVQIFTPKETMLLQKLRKGLEGKNRGYLLEYVIPKQTEWFPYFPLKKTDFAVPEKGKPYVTGCLFVVKSLGDVHIFIFFMTPLSISNS